MNSFYFQQTHNLKIGDRLVRHKGGIMTKHHGVYAGVDEYGRYMVAENQVGHGTRLVSLSKFFKNDESNLVRIERFNGNWNHRQEVIKRINKALGDSYNLVFNNCEHFANYVIHGVRKSPQVGKGLAFFLLLLLIICLPALAARK